MSEAIAPAPAKSGSLQIIAAENHRDLTRFIRLPNELYRGQKGFVPQLTGEAMKTLTAKSNPYFRHAQARYWLACRDGRPVGRISAQVDRLFLERHDAATGHFGFLDIADDAEAFHALTAVAEGWLRTQGMRRCLGPFSLSINEECGLMVEGFESLPMMMMPFALPYAGARLEEQGYRKVKDLIAYDYDIASARTIASQRLFNQVSTEQRVKIRPLDMARYDDELAAILDVFNDAWSDNWGFTPFTTEEIAAAAAAMRPILKPELVWIAELDGTPVSMIVALPNFYEAIRDLDGSIMPFGWLKLLWRLKVTGLRTSRVALFGVRRAYHRTPLGSVLVLLLLESLRQASKRLGIERTELSWILEDNLPMRRVIESVGGRPYKTFRLYEKALA